MFLIASDNVSKHCPPELPHPGELTQLCCSAHHNMALTVALAKYYVTLLPPLPPPRNPVLPLSAYGLYYHAVGISFWSCIQWLCIGWSPPSFLMARSLHFIEHIAY